ncbi:ABC transporter substrate-binding protein [Paenibacillus sp. N4]|uniref:ABC transporter substrate-binding protein n=1 Tax=Paenibacillus vietnamensis TaxID=2590547 RepID=UPI001CD0FCF1|nr:ABC transporter substrate-binding protein [Paenibacillus vietnamensis]MCA0757402.1 ABC transporter substrate-binding protein [Paenibacillus vietnamensis]
MKGLTRRKAVKLFVPLLVIVLLASCAEPAGKEAGSADETPPPEPVKLYLYVTGPTLTNTEFKTLIAEPVNKKYPHITIERIEALEGVTVQEVFTTKPAPDLTLIINPQPLIRLNVVEDLRPWIDKYQFDESRLKPVLYEHIKEFGEIGEIVSLPFNSNQAILYYNKDIFDKFGVEYPPNGKQLTLEEVLKLGKKLTRTDDDGARYIGYDTGGPTALMRDLALPVLDSETGDPLLTKLPEWTKIFQFLQQSYEVPGYIGPNNEFSYGRDAFIKDKNLALRVANLANMVGPLEELRQQGEEMNWDIAPTPNFEDRLGKAREAQVHSFVISNTSKHKEEAFLAITHILSDEVQRLLSRNARVPAIINPELEKEFGADVPVLEGKHIENVFVGEQQKNHKIHRYEDQVTKFVTEAAEQVAVGGADVNTALRNAEEAIGREIETIRNTEE